MHSNTSTQPGHSGAVSPKPQRPVWGFGILSFGIFLGFGILGFGICARSAPEPAASHARWQKDMDAFAAQDEASPPAQGGVLFLGSSSIRLWKTLAADFPGVPVLNRGFGGSRIADSTHYFDRLVMPSKPSLIVFWAGTNDINAGLDAEQVAADFRAFCARLHSALPGTRLIYISIALVEKRWEQRATVSLANTYIAAFCHQNPNLLFLDTNSALLTPDGKPRPELYRKDQLHMNEKGYDLWAKLLQPLVVKHWASPFPKSEISNPKP